MLGVQRDESAASAAWGIESPPFASYHQPVISALQVFQSGVDPGAIRTWDPSVTRLLPWVHGCSIVPGYGSGSWARVSSMPFVRSDVDELGGNGQQAGFPPVPASGFAWPTDFTKGSLAVLHRRVRDAALFLGDY